MDDAETAAAETAAAQLDAAAKREEALREAMEVMTRDLAAVTLRATTSETQCADLEKITIEQRTTAARTTVPQQGLGAQAGTFTTTTVNHTRSSQTPEFDGNKDSWHSWRQRFLFFLSGRGYRRAVRETDNPVMVGDDGITNEELLSKYSVETVAAARLSYELLLDAIDKDPPVLMKMLDAKSLCGAWKIMTNLYIPTSIMERRRKTIEFDAVKMVEGEDPVEYFGRIDKAVQTLTMFGGNKDEDEVNVRIVKNLSPLYYVDKKMLLSRPELTRTEIETVVRNTYLSVKVEVGGDGNNGGKEDVDPHALYADGVEPAGAGGGGTGKGRTRRGRQPQQQQ